MTRIINPILPGFNPDPSILRVGDDYYIATSTFEWWPGVQIHHSRDLVNWRLAAHPLTRVSQLDMRGNPSSCGIWAPCLTWSDGLFHLIYTDVKAYRNGQVYKDTPNCLVTAADICGEWSEPIPLNASGFDPSLFHDDDGRKWLVNMVVDHRPYKNRFGGIVLQEYDPIAKKLVGSIRKIFDGTSLGLCEGPHLYKINGWYYLMVAEGGTEFNHAVSMARSRAIEGPYEVDPENPVISSRYDARAPIQRGGHGSLVETQNGRWYIAHLCGRPIPNKGRCTLGRETAIQEVRWTPDGWLRTVSGTKATPVEVDAPGLPGHPWPPVPVRQEFDSPELDINFASPRVPLAPPIATLAERKGWLRLRGQQSPVCLFDQTLLARRVQHFVFRAEACLEFDPVNYQQMAGLMCVYDTDNHYYLQVTWDEEKGRVLWLQSMVNRNMTCPAAPLPLSAARVWLRAVVDNDRLQFFYALDGKTWQKYGPELNFATLSDEQYELQGEGRFTGAFVGMACHDMSGQRLAADFDYFDYDPDPSNAGLLSQSSQY